MGDTMGHKHQLQKSVPVKNHNHLGSGGLRRPGAPPLRDLNYNTRQMQQNNWQMSKGEDRMPAFPLGRASSGTGVYFPRIASHPPTKKTEIREDDSKTKEKKSETVETPFDSLEKLLPEEWTY